MDARRSLWPSAIFALVAAAWCLPAPAAAANFACQARISDLPPDPPPVKVRFEGLVSGGALPYDFHWDFGDGGTSAEQYPSHTYAEPGFYQATMTVTDTDVPQHVCRDTVLVLVRVVVDPICGAAANITWGDVPLAVEFDAYPALVPDPPPYTWSWRFGDDETSTLQYPTHVYGTSRTQWAVATLHTSTGSSYDCYPTLRITSLGAKLGVGQTTGEHGLRLEPPRPNPFGVMTVLGFELPRAGRVRVAILDPSGRSVATLVNDYRSAGRHVALWQGRTDAGARVPPGLYFVRLEHDGVVKHGRVVRLK